MTLWAYVVVYAPERWRETLRCAAGADIVVEDGGVGACDQEPESRRPRRLRVAFDRQPGGQ